MNTNLAKLQSYPFAKLAQLFADIKPNPALPELALTIGEPQHAPPAIVLEALQANLSQVQFYPSTRGHLSLREHIGSWLQNRFLLKNINPETQILPINGSREALFAIAQTVVNASSDALVLMPNPFYQIYEGAALLAGASPYYYCLDANGQFDFDGISAATWQRCQLLYICSPNNPTGSLLDMADLQKLIKFAQQYDFVIAADECYSEIYDQELPISLLQAAEAMGLDDYHNCLIFHSLSKRSNLPGLRSGFVAGDGDLIQQFFHYRTYHGCAMADLVQAASAVAWSDEQHVAANRDLYRQKFASVLDIFAPVWQQRAPQAGFYIYAKVGERFNHSGCEFARALYASQNLKVLPCAFLSRDKAANVMGSNVAGEYVRLALVASLEDCQAAAQRIIACVEARG